MTVAVVTNNNNKYTLINYKSNQMVLYFDPYCESDS